MNEEKNMPVMCFQKKDSDHPVCGIHNVSLVQNRIAIDPNAPGLGAVTCYVCAISRTVVQEGKRTYASNSIRPAA
jgi:catabolite regulation protein CreA